MLQYAKQTFIEEDKDSSEYDTRGNSDDNNKLEASEFTKQSSLTFVTTDGILQLIEEKCQEVSEILCMENDEILIILDHYKWRNDLIGEDWFQNEDKLRKKIGLEPDPQITLEKFSEMKCPGCYVSKPKEEFDSLKCNHLLCKHCWTEEIQFNVTLSKGSFFWKCPVNGCNLVLPHLFNQKYITDETRPQYDKKMAMTYTNTSKSFRWCPKANCQYGVDVVDSIAQGIECKCGWVYCFKCGQEDHMPCLCSVAREWIDYVKKDEDYNYDLASFKRCQYDLDIIDSLLKSLELSKDMVPQGVLNGLQKAFQTLRNTKRLQKWSYAYAFSLNDDVIKKTYKTLQEKADKDAKKLQGLLEWNYEKVDYFEYKEQKELIQAAESDCKKTSELLLNEVYYNIKDRFLPGYDTWVQKKA